MLDFECRLKTYALFSPRCRIRRRIFLSGAQQALSMGVAPESMFGCLYQSIESNLFIRMVILLCLELFDHSCIMDDEDGVPQFCEKNETRWDTTMVGPIFCSTC